jgi:hypothetical protein
VGCRASSYVFAWPLRWIFPTSLSVVVILESWVRSDESDEELEEFLAFTYAERRRDLA